MGVAPEGVGTHSLASLGQEKLLAGAGRLEMSLDSRVWESDAGNLAPPLPFISG